MPTSSERGLVLLTGARQTGKTTIAHARYSDLRYVNLDAPENREAVRATPTASWATTFGSAVFDEAQKEPLLFDKIKYAYDGGTVDFSLLLGSSQILLLKRIRESLAGRIRMREIWPLSMSELAAGPGAAEAEPPLLDRLLGPESPDQVLRNTPAALTDQAEASSRAAEAHLLAFGGMPALGPLDEDRRWEWLRDYERSYLERDLGDLARLDDLGPFKTFQRLAALRSGSLLNYSALAREAGLAVDTARRYLEYLRLSYQVFLLQPYTNNLTSAVVKTPKLYWTDVGLLRSLTRRRGEADGALFETMVAAETIKWLRTARRDAECRFYRTRSGMEVDLLIENEHGLLGIEIKSAARIGGSDLRGLRQLAEAAGKAWRGGLVVYRGAAVRRIDDRLWAVPSRRLFTAASA